MQTRCVCPLNE
uniref:Uncharacterized protein n=1 Tax=Anguilla anguilla TaxID=7936 RepID=A0A0E9PRZ9_ANGAN